MFVLMLFAQTIVEPPYSSRHNLRRRTRDLVKPFNRMAKEAESYSTRHCNEIEQEKVDAEIDRLFDFIEERDELDTIGCETFPERKISVLKHGDAQTVRDDGVNHFPEFFPKISQPSMSCSIYSLKSPCADCPLKYPHISCVSVGLPVRFSCFTAPAAGIGVSTYKSREETIGKKVAVQRTLLLACERLDLLRCEMNLISASSAFGKPPRLVHQELRETVTISDITVHLNSYFCRREPNDDCFYAFLTLLKYGTEVQTTAPISLFAHHRVRVRQLTFAEHIQSVYLPVDFNVVVEVCAMTEYQTISASWKRYWAVLRRGMIYLWRHRSDESFKKVGLKKLTF
ncbi:unnamed protein product [Angiostrongylus costaricensis]|uniref:Anillin domain-containing protein n=1 Tax=Angiostrongylus costaricensis TaxID=334426 RepID=A0A0R3PEH1_ANGCS|nr:unnamed protein product [Angiostrongylus costaricensis]